MQRQGDVLIVRINQLPHPEMLHNIEPIEDRYILFEGEGEGHFHALASSSTDESSDSAEVFEVSGRENELYLKLSRPCSLVHDEHAPLSLEAGLYRAAQQREYEWDHSRLSAKSLPRPEPLPATKNSALQELAGEISAEWDAALGARQLPATDRMANRRNARRWIDAAYRVAGLNPPRHIVWCGSPHTGAERAEKVLRNECCVADRIYGAMRTAQENIALRIQCSPGREFPLGHAARAWRSTCLLQQSQIAELLKPLGFDADPDEPRSLPLALLHCSWNQASPGELAWLEWIDEDTRNHDALLPLVALEQCCSAWWCYENTAILCDRPTKLHYDEKWRLHSSCGPAALYADESAIWAWRGEQVPPDFIKAPREMTLGDLQAQNLPRRVRRAMIERFGVKRFLMETISGGNMSMRQRKFDSNGYPAEKQPIEQNEFDAENTYRSFTNRMNQAVQSFTAQAILAAAAGCAHVDEFGELYVAPVVNDEPIVMVRVINATPEPNGSFKEYWLRVPPHVQTAREAVAWTFRLGARQYDPMWQT